MSLFAGGFLPASSTIIFVCHVGACLLPRHDGPSTGPDAPTERPPFGQPKLVFLQGLLNGIRAR